jgi:hypothetical protein
LAALLSLLASGCFGVYSFLFLRDYGLADFVLILLICTLVCTAVTYALIHSLVNGLRK